MTYVSKPDGEIIESLDPPLKCMDIIISIHLTNQIHVDVTIIHICAHFLYSIILLHDVGLLDI